MKKYLLSLIILFITNLNCYNTEDVVKVFDDIKNGKIIFAYNLDLSGFDFSPYVNSTTKNSFNYAIFGNANLNNTKFTGINLQGATFDDSSLTGTDLSNTELKDATFKNAYISKVNLVNAKNVDLSGVRIDLIWFTGLVKFLSENR